MRWAQPGSSRVAECGDVDSAGAVLTLESGTLAIVSNSRYEERTRTRCPAGDSWVEQQHRRGDRAQLADPVAEPGVTFPDGSPHHFFMDRLAAAFRAELAAFTDVVAGTIGPCTVADAVEVGRIAEAATLSLNEHRPVRLDEVRSPN